jgi:hypothetical protein
MDSETSKHNSNKKKTGGLKKGKHSTNNVKFSSQGNKNHDDSFSHSPERPVSKKSAQNFESPSKREEKSNQNTEANSPKRSTHTETPSKEREEEVSIHKEEEVNNVEVKKEKEVDHKNDVNADVNNHVDEASKDKPEEHAVDNEKKAEAKEKEIEHEHKEDDKKDDKEDDKVSEVGSKSSSNSNMSELFQTSTRTNAKRIRSQILDAQNNAIEYCKNLIRLSRNFERMKRKLHNKYNKFFTQIFQSLGYSYHSSITKHNLFVLCSEAWILELVKGIERSVKEKSLDLNNFKYSNLLEIIREVEINEDNYLSNLSLLTGSGSCDNTVNKFSDLIEMEKSIGSFFFINLNQIIQEDSKRRSIDTDFDKAHFEEILFDYLRKTVEKTLLDIEFQFDKSTSGIADKIDLYNTYSELSLKENKFSFEEYFEEVQGKVNFAPEEKFTLLDLRGVKICAEAFYQFSKSRFEELIEDLKLFTRNYTSIMFKTKRLFAQGMSNAIHLQQLAKFYFKSTLFNMERIFNYKLFLKRGLRLTARGVKHCNYKLKYLKEWLTENVTLEKYFYSPLLTCRELTYKSVNYTVEKTANGVKFVILKTKDFADILKVKEIKENLFKYFEKLSLRFGNLKEKLFHSIKIAENSEEFTVEISKELYKIDSKLFEKIYTGVNNLITNSLGIFNANYKFLQQKVTSAVEKLKRMLTQGQGECQKREEEKIN